MIPENYEIAIAALDALWEVSRGDSLGSLLGSMRPMASGDDTMDSAALGDWKRIVNQAKNASEFDLILSYLEHDASLYKEVPDDLQSLIEALRKEGTPERLLVDSVITSWNQTTK
jgi:hypothetical protein